MSKATDRIPIYVNIGKFKAYIFEGGLWIVYPPFATAKFAKESAHFALKKLISIICL